MLGGVSFLIYIFIAISYTIRRFFDYISWGDSKIQFIEKSINPSPALNFKDLNFSYALKITFENDTSIKNSSLADLFEIEQNFVFKNLTNSYKTKNLPRQCTKNDFYGKIDQYPIFSKDSLDNFICFDIYENYTLQGVYTDNIMSYIEIMLKINDNYFKNFNNLKTIFENDSFKFTLYYKDVFNDVTNFTEPVFDKIDAIYTYLDLNYYKRNNIYFQQFNFSSDKNLFYNSYEMDSYMKLFSNQEINSPIFNRETYKKEEKSYLNKFLLRAVNNQKTVKLAFVKIPEFLASLSGLLINILIILRIIFTALNFFEAKQSIMSKIMKYKDIIKKTDKNSLNYLEKKFHNNNYFNLNNPHNLYVPQTENIYPDVIITNDNENNNNQNKNITQILNIDDKVEFSNRYNSNTNKTKYSDKSINNQENRLNEILDETIISDISTIREIRRNKNPYLLTISDILKAIFCCKCRSKGYNKKINIFKNAEMKFNYNLDLVTYMKKMQEIEILKYIILDKDTIHLMNFISKPSVCLTNNCIKDEEYLLFFENLKNTNSLNTQNIDNVKNAFDKLTSKPTHSEIEKRILKLFNLQVQEILN